MKTLKFIAAVFLGFMLATLLIDILHKIGPSLFSGEANATVELITLAFSFSISAFIGGLLSHLISRQKALLDALSTGLILTILGVYYAVQNELPTGMLVLSIVCFIPFAFLGAKVLPKQKSSQS